MCDTLICEKVKIINILNLYRFIQMKMDEGFPSTVAPKGTKFKRGKGSQKQKNVAVLSESIPLEGIETRKKTSQIVCYKIKVLET